MKTLEEWSATLRPVPTMAGSLEDIVKDFKMKLPDQRHLFLFNSIPVQGFTEMGALEDMAKKQQTHRLLQEEVIEQARRLAEAGHRELVLTGVDITADGADMEGAPAAGRGGRGAGERGRGTRRRGRCAWWRCGRRGAGCRRGGRSSPRCLRARSFRRLKGAAVGDRPELVGVVAAGALAAGGATAGVGEAVVRAGPAAMIEEVAPAVAPANEIAAMPASARILRGTRASVRRGG